MKEKSKVVINIKGGNNQILPDATTAVQNFNFYGDRAEQKPKAGNPTPEVESTSNVNEEVKVNDGAGNSNEPEIPYIKKECVNEYAEKLRNCATAREAGVVVARMVREAELFEETAKKEMFIGKIIPLLDHVTTGRTVNNLRKQISIALDEPQKG